MIRVSERSAFFCWLDDAVMEIETGWPALIRNTRHIGDFRNWKDHDAYQQAFGRLLRNLKAGENPDGLDGRIGGAGLIIRESEGSAFFPQPRGREPG